MKERTVPDSEKYVVVVDDDRDEDGPLVFEQYLSSADLPAIRKRADWLRGQPHFKSVRIAQITLIDEGETNHDR